MNEIENKVTKVELLHIFRPLNPLHTFPQKRFMCEHLIGFSEVVDDILSILTVDLSYSSNC